tara:strand:- start:40 stop:168 length:129 start_codon:yes stop_codon:yes gene_type:complete
MTTLTQIAAFFIFIIVLEKAVNNLKVAICAAILLLFLVNCVG